MTRSDYIICLRVAKAVAKGSYIAPGSLTATCTKCGTPVFVSPSSLEIRHVSPNSQLICIECALPMMKDSGEIMELTPAQVKEIEEHRRRR